VSTILTHDGFLLLVGIVAVFGIIVGTIGGSISYFNYLDSQDGCLSGCVAEDHTHTISTGEGFVVTGPAIDID